MSSGRDGRNHRMIKNDIFPTMNETNHVLMEFDPHGTSGITEMRYCVEYALDRGYAPIIAHAERYKRIKENKVYFSNALRGKR